MALLLLHVAHYLLLPRLTSISTPMSQWSHYSLRVPQSSQTRQFYSTEAEPTQRRIQETGWRARVELQTAQPEAEQGMPHIREKGLSTAAQPQGLVFHSPSRASLQGHHTPVTSLHKRPPQHHLQLCFWWKLLHLYSVTAQGLLNKKHGNS